MSVDIPQPFNLGGEIDVNTDIDGELGLNTDLSGDVNLTIPTKYTIGIDQLPKIQLGLDPVELKPVNLNLSLKEIPSVRLHLPADFKVGLSLLGTELLTLRLCGKAQAITEDYIPNPCEQRRDFSRSPNEASLSRLDLVNEMSAAKVSDNG